MPLNSPSERWFNVPRARPRPRARLSCSPSAGGRPEGAPARAAQTFIDSALEEVVVRLLPAAPSRLAAEPQP